ncbi:MAG: acetylornithine/succinylornithine family transaminase [Clostridiales bacterium]|nr:acetylornithine/succinylornithine family transaminase [Clostridiales bacterium]
MTFEELKALDHQYTMQTYGRFDVALDHGQGSTLYGLEGEEYIDFASGIGVASLGYGHPAWLEAVETQAHKLAHASNLFYTEPYARLAEKLCTRSGMAAAFFANGGGEANEGIIKLARKYSFDKYGKGRANIITLHNSFHGRTITTLQATGQDVFHNYFFPFTEGFRYAEANDLASVQAQAGEDTCAVFLELIQGEGGVLPLDKSFVQDLAAYCAENDYLLLVDEVQTGIGRTGSLFCFQQYGIQPDAVTFAKGIAGGLPMAGVLCNEKCRNVLTPGTHATTFGGNPIAAAAACAVLDTMDGDFLAAVNEKGEYLRAAITSFNAPCVETVRGMGLMVGIVLKDGVDRAALVKQIYDSNVLVLTAGPKTIRLLPPLVITQAEMDRGLAVLKTVLCGE